MPIERDTYRQRLARLLRVDERALVGGEAPAVPRSGRRAPRVPKAQKPQTPDLTVGPAQIARKLESPLAAFTAETAGCGGHAGPRPAERRFEPVGGDRF